MSGTPSEKVVRLMLRIRGEGVQSFKMTQKDPFRWDVVGQDGKFVTVSVSEDNFAVIKGFRNAGLQVDEILVRELSEEVAIDLDALGEPQSPCSMGSIAQ